MKSEKTTGFLSSRLALFQETWEASLMKAKEHGEDLKIVKEQTRLEALAEIQDQFRRTWEVTA